MAKKMIAGPFEIGSASTGNETRACRLNEKIVEQTSAAGAPISFAGAGSAFLS
jgi:hypothetical protein